MRVTRPIWRKNELSLWVLGVLAVVLMVILATKEKAWPQEESAPAETAPAPLTAATAPTPPSPALPGFEWMSPAAEASPGFGDPNRTDPRTPTGDPLLHRGLPQGPDLSAPERP